MSRFMRDLLAGTPEMLDAFGDASLIRYALAFEAALAQASAEEKVIDKPTADAISAACAALSPSPESLAQQAAHAGTLAIPLVAMLRQSISDPKVADAVHLGATSQDVADTALVLQMKDGATLIERELHRMMTAVRVLAQKHVKTPMVGRTLLQPALPITFGLKCANWLLALRDDRTRFQREQTTALVVQFGGAVGTRDKLGGHGDAIAAHMAAALGLGSAAPWHTRRNNLVAFANAVACITTTLGKIAGDIALMAQTEVGEVAEPAVAGRGGSSAMPHKRNPTGCQTTLSAATRIPGLMSNLLASAINEHERGLGGWQSEAATISDLFVLSHGALTTMAAVLEGLVVNTDAMRHNLERAGVGQNVGDAEAQVAKALAVTGGDR